MFDVARSLGRFVSGLLWTVGVLLAALVVLIVVLVVS